ncbi:MAG: alpha/beta hydrolase [Planctomycetota bacterium]|nr:alpha/beta hydrolase [Planctomycetota bacterium]
MPLDPQAKAFLEQSAPAPPFPHDTDSINEIRKLTARLEGDPEPAAKVEDRVAPALAAGIEIPVRIYWPAGADESTSPKAGFVFFHGGGWVLGNLDAYDHLCHALANAGDCVVMSVDYRLAPEHKFPAAADDCYAAAAWTAQHADELGIDPKRIVVGGDSAGGNLAAVVSLMDRDRDTSYVSYQVLIYPITDANLKTPSYLENGQGYFLTTERMAWFWDLYLNDPSEASNPYASPLQAESLAGLPPAYMMTAEFDPLLSEGDAYADRLEAAGVPVERELYDGQIHGFVRRIDLYDRATVAINRIGGLIRRVGDRGND